MQQANRENWIEGYKFGFKLNRVERRKWRNDVYIYIWHGFSVLFFSDSLTGQVSDSEISITRRFHVTLVTPLLVSSADT